MQQDKQNYRYNKFIITGKPRKIEAFESHLQIFNILKNIFSKTVYIDQSIQQLVLEANNQHQLNLKLTDNDFINLEQQVELVKQVDCVIVVGGDGNFIRALDVFSNYSIPLIGVNKGNLGFLTEINPNDVCQKISLLAQDTDDLNATVLESRNLIMLDDNHIVNDLAINGQGDHRLIRLNVQIDNHLAFEMVGDGLIVSTPTGSTAYNLSCGGPIVHPEVPAIIVTPVCPHTLTSRPIVVPISSEISITLKDHNFNAVAELYADGKILKKINSGMTVKVKVSPSKIQLIHFKDDYNYYDLLSKKLGWSSKLFS